MGQALSASASSNAALHVQRAVVTGAVPTCTVLIDLDNAAFNPKDQMDFRCMTKRLDVVARTFKKAKEVRMFCNKATMAFLKKNNFRAIELVTSTEDNDGDSADHALLRCFASMTHGKRKTSVAIVTHDKTLSRLATYMRPDGCTLRFATFRGTCDSMSVFDESRYPLFFASADELDKFMTSLALFRRRLTTHKKAVAATSRHRLQKAH